MKNHINKEMVQFILKNIGEKDKVSFVLELVDAWNKKSGTGDSSALERCLVEWEATAEVNSIPGFREGTFEGLAALRKIGVIK